MQMAHKFYFREENKQILSIVDPAGPLCFLSQKNLVWFLFLICVKIVFLLL